MQVLLTMQVQQADSAGTGTSSSVLPTVAATVLLHESSCLVVKAERKTANDLIDRAKQVGGWR